MAYLVGDIVVVGSWITPGEGQGFVGQFALLRAQPGLPLIRTDIVRGAAPYADLFEAAEAGCQAGIEAAKRKQGNATLIPLPYPPGPLPV
ncbi:MAG TPA: hypothetical protein VFH59_13880 [Frateuria sp.]|uniref:hypothetical protein n=1 Tax=Frateuria sp. TaxID=2211372 RepID=UPI002D8115DA|nr:hypothetical protein [Frateuria sp.]HET6806519.1 hypothetical protein [Frateuria sp.]